MLNFPINPLDLTGVSSPLLAVSMKADVLLNDFAWLSNSMLVAIFVALAVLLFCRAAASSLKSVPGARQNVFEAIVEFLYSGIESIVGRHMIAKVFPLLGTFFIFILVSNWFGLLPGVGTIGFGPDRGPGLSLHEIDFPILRPGTADLNFTLALATVFTVLWLYWSIREMGFGGFLFHIFGPKGGLKGVMAIALLPLFLFVGVIEVVSMAFRPVSLSLRLFGNVFAGENLLHAMLTLGDKLPTPFQYIGSVLFPLPFYFLEILVGLLQALVFTLLCSVYIQLSTSHDEEEGHGHSH